MFNDVFDYLFADLIASCVPLDGVVYVPVESFLSSTGAWFTIHVILWTGIAFVTWQLMSLIKTLIECLFVLIRRSLSKKFGVTDKK